jgi:hypothetical protein
MRALAGCRRCGHVERIRGNPDAGVEVGTCPRCNGPLRSLGLLGAHLLAKERRRASGRLGSSGAARAEG